MNPNSPKSDFEISVERPNSADSIALITELEGILGPLYPDESRHGYSVEKLIAQGVHFFVGRLQGQAAACGGVQFYGPAYGELIEFRHNRDRSARGRLQANDIAGEWFTIPFALSFLSLSGMDIGRNSLSPLSNAYQTPFPFAGTIEKVTVLLDRPSASKDKLLDD